MEVDAWDLFVTLLFLCFMLIFWFLRYNKWKRKGERLDKENPKRWAWFIAGFSPPLDLIYEEFIEDSNNGNGLSKAFYVFLYFIFYPAVLYLSLIKGSFLLMLLLFFILYGGTALIARR
jgi:hypothetical protein